jgi:hypothetical protein
MSTIKKLRHRKISGLGLENRDYGRRRSSALSNTLYPQELALISPTHGGGSVGIVRSRTQATKIVSLSISSCSVMEPWKFF